MPATRTRPPSLRHERELWAEGLEAVVGLDEVGRGAWAGPLTIGAAVVPRDRRVYRVRDSKQVPEPERERLFERIADWCVAWGIGHAEQWECDELGMSAAQRLAARRAIDAVGVTPDMVLIDGSWDFVADHPTRTIVKGDASCLSIASASILAKVVRDRRMRTWTEHHPEYGFDSNKGYPSPHHRAALAWFGPSAIHRRSWVFMDKLPWTGLTRYDREAALQPTLWEEP